MKKPPRTPSPVDVPGPAGDRGTLRLSATAATLGAWIWVLGIFLVYLRPAAGHGWWAIPFQAFDLLPGAIAQLRPGPYFASRLTEAALGIGTTVLLLGACLGAGRMVLEALRIVPADRLWRGLVSAGAGAWLLSTAVLLLGSAGVFSRAVHAAMLLFFLAVGVVFAAARGNAPANPESPRRSPKDAGLPPLFAAGLAACAVAAGLLLFAGALTPPFEYDALEYHLAAPAAYLASGRIGFVPGNVYANFPALTEMLFLEALLFRAERAVKLIHLLFGFGAALAIGSWGSRRWGRVPGLGAAALFLAMPFTLQLAMTARIDLATAFFGAAAMLETVDAVRTRDRGSLLRAALLTGAACATKYTAIVLVAAPVGALLVVGAFLGIPSRREAAATAFRRLLVVGAVSLLCLAPWLVKNAVLTGNPVYPLFAGILGGRDWSPELGILWRAKHLHPDLATAVGTFFAKIPAYSFAEGGAVPAFAMLLPLLLFRRNEERFPRIRLLGGIVLLSAAAWALATYSPWRFLYPALGALCLLAGAALDGWSPARGAATAARVGLSLCLVWGILLQALTLAVDARDPSRRPARVSPLTWISGRITEGEFLGPAADPVFWMNEHLPGDATVLYLGEARTYYSRHRYVADTVYNRSRLVPLVAGAGGPDEIARRFREAGITHLYLNVSELERLRRNYGYLRDIDMNALAEFLGRYGEVIYDRGGRRTVWRLRWDGGDAG